MGIMDMFRSANPVPSVAPQTTNPSAANSANPSTNGNPPVPGVSTGTPGGGQAKEEPNFENLWTPPKEGEEGLPDFNPSDLFNIDPAKVAQAVQGIDYSKAVSPEQMQAIAEGGEGAIQAFAQAMNSVAQQATQVSMIGSAKLIEQALSKANATLDSRMAEQIRKHSVSSGLKEKNPIFSNPAYAPMVSAIEHQFRAKYPNASAPEITELAEKYVFNFAQSVAGKKDADASAASKLNEPDWEALFFPG